MSNAAAKTHWGEISATILVRFYNLAVNLISLVVITRLLGPAGQGMIAAATSWAGLVATISGLSLGQVSQHRIQALRTSAWDGRLFGALIYLLLLLSILSYAGVAVVYLITGGSVFGQLPLSVLLLAFLLIPLLIWDEYASHLLTAAGRLKTYNRLLVMGRTFSLALILILVGVMQAGVHGALAASLAGQSMIAGGSYYFLWRLHKPGWRVSGAEILALLNGAWRLHPNTIGSFLLASSSILVLNSLGDSAMVGWYHVAWQMITVLMIAPQATGLILYARIAQSGADGAWPEQKRIMAVVIAVMLGVSVIFFFLGPEIIVLLTGEDFRNAGPLFQILLPALIGMSLAQLMAPQWISRGIFLPTSVITMLTAVIHILVTIHWVRLEGMTGAAWATGLTLSILPILVQGIFGWWCERRFRHSFA